MTTAQELTDQYSRENPRDKSAITFGGFNSWLVRRINALEKAIEISESMAHMELMQQRINDLEATNANLGKIIRGISQTQAIDEYDDCCFCDGKCEGWRMMESVTQEELTRRLKKNGWTWGLVSSATPGIIRIQLHDDGDEELGWRKCIEAPTLKQAIDDAEKFVESISADEYASSLDKIDF